MSRLDEIKARINYEEKKDNDWIDNVELDKYKWMHDRLREAEKIIQEGHTIYCQGCSNEDTSYDDGEFIGCIKYRWLASLDEENINEND